MNMNITPTTMNRNYGVAFGNRGKNIAGRGKTALDYAKKQGNEEIVRILYKPV